MEDTAQVSLARQEAQEASNKTIFGFWVYIMTDCVLFASLFAVYAVLRSNTYGGPRAGQLFSLPYALAETLILLTSSFTIGLAILAAHSRVKKHVLFWLAVTFLLGIAFLTLELHEFSDLASAGNSWRRSGFLSSFFTLVGTHGLHITSGLIWIAVMFKRIHSRGLGGASLKRLTMLSIFWHFFGYCLDFYLHNSLSNGSIRRMSEIANQGSRYPGSIASYTVGFLLSIGLTIDAYSLVNKHIYAGWKLVYAIVALAIVQLFVQMFCFLHLGRGPNKRWNLLSFGLMLVIVLIVVIGSLWIMHNLNYRMTPQQMNDYMTQQDGGI